MFVKANNGVAEKFPYTIGELRRENPNTSFPKNIPDSVLAEYNVFRVTEQAMPSFDGMTHKAERAALPVLSDGQWVWGWDVAALTAEQIADRDAVQAESIRRERNRLLAETDWMALSDNTMSPAWAAYRQALRDITNHVNFPHLQEADWPAKPE